MMMNGQIAHFFVPLALSEDDILPNFSVIILQMWF